MRGILLAFLLAFSGISHAEFLEPPAYGACRDRFNNPVQYIPLPSHIFKSMNPRSTFATTKGGMRPTVMLDAGLLSQYGPEFQRMVHWHECGHHALGHLPPASYFSEKQNRRQQEDDADCYSAKMIPREDLRIAVDELANTGMGGGHAHRPSSERAGRILTCPR